VVLLFSLVLCMMNPRKSARICKDFARTSFDKHLLRRKIGVQNP